PFSGGLIAAKPPFGVAHRRLQLRARWPRWRRRGVGPMPREDAMTGQARVGWRASGQGNLTHACRAGTDQHEIGRDTPRPADPDRHLIRDEGPTPTLGSGSGTPWGAAEAPPSLAKSLTRCG